MAKNWKTISQLIEVENIETHDGGSFLLEEHMDIIETKLEANTSEIDQLKTEAANAVTAKTTAESALAAAEQKVTDANEKVTTSTARITTLEAELQIANEKLALRSKDEKNPITGGQGEEKSGAEKLAEMPHIIEAKNYLKTV